MADENNNENTGQNEQNNKTENINYNSLTPKESDNYDKYQDAFIFALNSDDESKKITNIAVTGPYASGKSSVIENVKNKFGSEKFITLSLTNFNSGDIENDNKIQENSITNKKIEEDLEAQLINQLIHKIDSKKIEDSRFLANKKIDTSKLSYKVGTFIHALIISIIFLCLIIVNINNETISKILFLKLDDIKITSINILFIVGSIYSLYFGYKIINLFKKKKILRKINIYGNEIELFNNEDNSIFDKYTDEILYLFKNAGVKYFIFEDIDRYEDVTIFKKLREINILLNETLKREDKEYKPIKFIYLICDNMFTAEERTKFFDFIIPVVPYIHKGNAYDYMAELFADEIKDERNKKFLIKISLFIDNSRLLKNIANEYYIYSKFITIQDRKPHTKFIKLLSLIIYKNLFPKDFNQLYFNKGYLAELLDHNSIINRMKKEYFIDYIQETISKSKDDFKLKKFLNNKLKEQSIKNFIEYNFKDVNNFFILKNKYNYIYNNGNFGIIKLFILNSYIDIDYNSYLSAITTNTLSKNMNTFIRNILTRNGTQYDYSLPELEDKKNLDNFLLYIDEDNLKQKEILNIDLFKSLILHNYIYEPIMIIKGISIHENYYFILHFYKYICISKEMYKKFSNNYFMEIREIFIEKYEKMLYFFHSPYQQYNYYFYKLAINFIVFYHDIFQEIDMYEIQGRINPTDIEKIKAEVAKDINYVKCLDEFNSSELILQHKEYIIIDIKETVLSLKYIGIIFDDITPAKDEILLNTITSQYMFKPTYNNIVHILTETTNINPDKIKRRPYTYLLNSEDNDLIEYVQDNIMEFIESCPYSIIRRDRELQLFILYSPYFSEEDREELKTRFNIK